MTILECRGLREGRLSEAHEQTVPTSQQGVDQAQLAEAFSRLVATARAVGLYGEAHPAALSRAGAAAESLTRAASHGLRRLAVINASLRSEAGEIPHDADLIELGKTLDRMGIAAIELVSPPQDGVVAMAGVLWAAMASPVHLPDFPARIELAGHGVLRMTVVDYKRLKVVEGSLRCPCMRRSWPSLWRRRSRARTSPTMTRRSRNWRRRSRNPARPRGSRPRTWRRPSAMRRERTRPGCASAWGSLSRP